MVQTTTNSLNQANKKHCKLTDLEAEIETCKGKNMAVNEGLLACRRESRQVTASNRAASHFQAARSDGEEPPRRGQATVASKERDCRAVCAALSDATKLPATTEKWQR